MRCPASSSAATTIRGETGPAGILLREPDAADEALLRVCSVIGEVLADLATGDGAMRHDIEFLRLRRPRMKSLPVRAAELHHHGI